MSSIILGISAYYHDSAAALLINGEILAAAQEERFTRKKHDPSFPINAVRYVLDAGGVGLNDLEYIAFYDKPFIKFERLLETYHAFAPKGLISFLVAIPVWIKEKIFLKKALYDELAKIEKTKTEILFPEHHLSHAASAFFPSPFEEAAILTLDGVGEWATTTISDGEHNNITMLKELDFPHSIGLLYSAFTYYCGFRVNSGEYKLMGLAPYGNVHGERKKVFKQKITENIVDIREDGSLLLNMKYFNYATGLKMCNEKKWAHLLGIQKRNLETELTQDYMDLALAIQEITEEIVLKLTRTAKKLTKRKNLVMAGGVALNCVANGKILKENIFNDLWIQPAAGDAGGAVGAALAAWHIYKGEPRHKIEASDSMKGAYLGPEYCSKDIEKIIKRYQAPYKYFDKFEELSALTSNLLAEGNVIGWFQGKMEFGPRALGNRSILGDARNPEMQKRLNLKIKYRESFRPFAPSVLEEDMGQYFQLDKPSPYMLLVAPVQSSRKKRLPANYDSLELKEKLYYPRSDIPAVTHIDFSARIQSVNRKVNDKYWTLINDFKKLTGFGIIINTSFNVRGEPIVCTPFDAFQCFMRTDMDYLVIDNYFFAKSEQKIIINEDNWQENFPLD